MKGVYWCMGEILNNEHVFSLLIALPATGRVAHTHFNPITIILVFGCPRATKSVRFTLLTC
jgi:hypothetical protein